MSDFINVEKKKIRCPKGSRRNKHGDCVSIGITKKPYIINKDGELLQFIKASSKKMKKTPLSKRKTINKYSSIGYNQLTQRQKAQLYEYISESESELDSSPGKTLLNSDSSTVSSTSPSPVTPRTTYAKTFFAPENPILLLNKFNPNPEHKLLFQVSFSSPDQFIHYQNLTSPTHTTQKLDCFFQSLFSLGLRNVKDAKKDSRIINTTLGLGKGVSGSSTEDYLANVFGLRPGQVEHVIEEIPIDANGNYSHAEGITKIYRKLIPGLKENHATIIGLTFYNGTKLSHGHALIAYKYNKQLFFFNPQRKGDKPDEEVLANRLHSVIKTTKKIAIGRFGYYEIHEMPEPLPAINVRCPILA